MTPMPDDELAYLSLADARRRLDQGDISAVELTQAMLERIQTLDPQLNAFITVLGDSALQTAAATDTRLRQGERAPLLGIPLAVKDLFNTAGVRTTGGARILSGNVPESDATVVTKLAAAGSVLLGKTNMMEFAYGYPHPDFGETRNPWALDRTAGGSSGGSAAAVAAGLAYGALGSDTGGSIRSPASYCNVVGLKATYGRISRAGVLPLSWSLDHAGPLARTVEDTAILFDAIAGFDPLDPASAHGDWPAACPALNDDISGLRIGVVDEMFERDVQPDVRATARAAIEQLGRLAVTLEAVMLPHLDLIAPVIDTIVQAEATSYHRHTLEARPNDYSDEVRDNLRLGATILAVDYIDAQRIRRRLLDGVNEALANYDLLVYPTQPIVAPLLDSYTLEPGDDEAVLDIEISHTGLANLTGHPALSLPGGFTDAGLPVGLQFIGRAFDEATLLRLGHAFQQITTWHRERPPLGR
jgi:aspartyl-tRNA(Asn)/glutamyl-tRNA(Gln) amidotransferase subunit A